jgi:hypothetical protein
VAKSSNANEQTWEKRVWIYAKVSSLLSWGCDVFIINFLPFFPQNVYNSTRLEVVAPSVAKILSKKCEMDY